MSFEKQGSIEPGRTPDFVPSKEKSAQVKNAVALDAQDPLFRISQRAKVGPPPAKPTAQS